MVTIVSTIEYNWSLERRRHREGSHRSVTTNSFNLHSDRVEFDTNDPQQIEDDRLIYCTTSPCSMGNRRVTIGSLSLESNWRCPERKRLSPTRIAPKTIHHSIRFAEKNRKSINCHSLESPISLDYAIVIEQWQHENPLSTHCFPCSMMRLGEIVRWVGEKEKEKEKKKCQIMSRIQDTTRLFIGRRNSAMVERATIPLCHSWFPRSCRLMRRHDWYLVQINGKNDSINLVHQRPL